MDAKAINLCAQILTLPLVVDGDWNSAQAVRELLRKMGSPAPLLADGADDTLAKAALLPPSMFILDADTSNFDAPHLAKALRRSSLICRQAPILVMVRQPTIGLITQARDCGVDTVLRKPFTLTDLFKRVQALASQPRDWIEAQNYVGPDRRRFDSGARPAGADRRGKRKGAALEPSVLTCANRLAVAARAFETSPDEALQIVREEHEKLARLGAPRQDPNLTRAINALAGLLSAHEATSEALDDCLQILAQARA